MPRWQPGARERLQATTLELFAEQGFEATTVAEIASRAGLTERTFFRYFADKREVLFAGQDVFEGMFVEHIVAAPPDAEPFAIVVGAVRAVATDFFPAERRRFSLQRQTSSTRTPGCRSASCSSSRVSPRRWPTPCTSAAHRSRPRSSARSAG